jgi:hypothetical protein
MTTAKVYVTAEDGQVVACTLTLQRNNIEVDANKGYRELVEQLMEREFYDGDDVITVDEDPKRWFSLLPKNVTGSYMRAVIEQ